MKPVLVVGDLVAEILLQGLSGHPGRGREVFVSQAKVRPGGAGAKVAAALSRLGRDVTLVAKVGKDDLGDSILQRLGTTIDFSGLSRDRNAGTGMTIAFSDDDEASLVTYPGATSTLGPGDLDRLRWERFGHLHLASPFQLLGLPIEPLLRRVRERKITVSLSLGGDPRERWSLDGLYPLLDLLLLSESQAKALKTPARRLADKVPLVVLRRGDRGSVARTSGREWTSRLPAGGAAFDAAFLDGWLEGHRVGEILTYAGAASTLSFERGGGIDSTPTRAEALHEVGRNKPGKDPS
jgi:sugar/nucleoside kinase (ribokinase family)